MSSPGVATNEDLAHFGAYGAYSAYGADEVTGLRLSCECLNQFNISWMRSVS